MKNMGKLTILMIAVVAIGIFALPSVMSVGTGQHTFLNRTQVECNKCHTTTGDAVNAELLASGVTVYTTLGSAPGTKIHNLGVGIGSTTIETCEDCHALQTGPRTTDHTGVTRIPQCTTCHTTVDAELQGAAEPHSGLNATAQGNKGCMGCHTDVVVTGRVSYSYGAGYTNVLGLNIGNGAPPVNP